MQVNKVLYMPTSSVVSIRFGDRIDAMQREDDNVDLTLRVRVPAASPTPTDAYDMRSETIVVSLDDLVNFAHSIIADFTNEYTREITNKCP
jgi:hypothetical protein